MHQEVITVKMKRASKVARSMIGRVISCGKASVRGMGKISERPIKVGDNTKDMK